MKFNLNKKNNKIIIAALIIIVIAIIVLYIFVIAKPANTRYLLSRIDNPVSSHNLQLLHNIAVNYSLANSVGMSLTSFPSLTGNTNITIVNGKPTVVYLGAEYCPFCAITRWGLILAMMRFGNFTNLHYMVSSSTDVYPNTPTFTFYNSNYTSKYINFEMVEAYNRSGDPLQTPNELENLTFSAYDSNNSALPSNDRGGIPFVDFGNYSYEVGALILPTTIDGYTWDEVINKLSDPSTHISKNIIGVSNVYTAQICYMINYTAPACKNNTYVKPILKLQKEES